jgi:sialate O-acetylesterase
MTPLADVETAPGRLSVTTVAPPPPPSGNAWKAKVPGAAGGDCTITATDGKNSATLEHVTYGDVWYCGGQSNMALPVSNTFSRFASEAAIRSGKYANIRIKQMGESW